MNEPAQPTKLTELASASVATNRPQAGPDDAVLPSSLGAWLETAPFPVAVYRGAEHVYGFANAAYRAIFAGRLLVGRRVREVEAELAGHGVLDLLDRVYATGEPLVADVFPGSIVRDGREVEGMYRLTVTPLRDAHGAMEGLVAVGVAIGPMLDVAERERLEAALREQSLVTRLVVDNQPELAWTARPDGHIDFYNARWYEYTGTTFEAMQGWGWQTVHDPAMLPEVAARWQHSLATGEPFEMEFRLRGADGTFRWFLTRVRPLRDPSGRIVRWFGTNTDIEDVRRLRDRVTEVLEATHDAFFALDRDYRIVLVNANHERVTGVTRAEALGKDLYDVFPAARDPCSKYWTEYHRVVEERVAVQFEEFYAPLGLWTEVRASPTPEGGVAVFYRDVTDRKRIEVERAELLARAQRAQLEAEAARAQAEGANRMKDEFLATVSHELRTPLNAILGWGAMLAGGALDAPTQARAFATIERNARAQARLIDDLLDLSRVLQGKFVLAVGPVELVRVVEAALDAARPAAEAKGVRLQPVLDSHATIVGDPERLQQVAWNLLSNAVKFTPRGGRVRVTLRRSPSYVELTVADTGQGIAPEFVPHVFEAFRQAEGGPTRRSGGLGLGLSIVRSLVELHGGAVSAASDGPGCGATFTVRLPMAPLRADTGTPPPPSFAPGEPARVTFECPPALASLRVLVVDDEPDTRELLAFVLGQCHAVVVEAASVAEAYAALEGGRFDVLISDVGMPGEDGLSLMRRVRRLPAEGGGRIPALALTAYARSEDRAQALRAGFSMHLSKPIEPTELLLTVAALAETRRM